ncbi:hypothetical protein AVEN_152808-1 [Araneus ventricosus]|uniref:Uncharacterized protein n=1 Tax=Araneus ventricosus TaxID=182803 RepID=A0A4Y2LH97_ARAVE|nr:hypothetical protein AVEN_152808-1 [Araneus ventricosus]
MRNPTVLPTSDSGSKNNCLFEAISPQLDKKNILSADGLRNKYIDNCLRNPKRMEEIIKNRSIIKSRDPDALYEGGCDDFFDYYWSTIDAHDVVNQVFLLFHHKKYRELYEQLKEAKPEENKYFFEQLYEIEDDEFNKTKLQQAEWNNSILNFMLISAVNFCTGGVGLGAYILSRAAVSGTLTVLDDKFHHCIKQQDYAGAWD